MKKKSLNGEYIKRKDSSSLLCYLPSYQLLFSDQWKLPVKLVLLHGFLRYLSKNMALPYIREHLETLFACAMVGSLTCSLRPVFGARHFLLNMPQTALAIHLFSTIGYRTSLQHVTTLAMSMQSVLCPHSLYEVSFSSTRKQVMPCG